MLTIERLRAVLDYNPITGEFTWLPRPRDTFASTNAHRTWNTRYAGRAAGVSTHGYRKIAIDDEKHYAHRLAWFWVHGAWPLGLIDHVNRDKSDNRIANLREADKSLNGANATAVRGSLGVRGVTRLPSGRYMAQINHRARHFYLGSFDTIDEARQAYAAAAAERFGEFAAT